MTAVVTPVQVQSQRLAASTISRVTGMRGAAAFYVFLSHIWYEIWPAVPWPQGYAHYPEPSWAAWTGWLYYGHFSVVSFILISGYCLGRKPFPSRPAPFLPAFRNYLGRRSRRILPPYFVALVASFILAQSILSGMTGRQWDISLPSTWMHLVSNMLLLQDFMEPTRINYVFWSIAVEFQLYFTLPFFSRLCDRYGTIGIGLASITGVYALIVSLTVFQIHFLPPQFLDLIAFFLFGILLARAERSSMSSLLERVPWTLVIVSSFGILSLLCVAIGHELVERSFVVADLFCVVGTAGIILGKGTPFRYVFEWRPLVWLGGISYSLYLIHAPLIHLVWLQWVHPTYLSEGGQFLLLGAFSIPIVIMVSWLFHLTFEKPFLPPEHIKT